MLANGSRNAAIVKYFADVVLENDLEHRRAAELSFLNRHFSSSKVSLLVAWSNLLELLNLFLKHFLEGALFRLLVLENN